MRWRRLLALAAALLAAGAAAFAGPGAESGGSEAAGPAADRPLAALPAEGPLHLLAFGTSLTAASPWPDRLVARLAGCLGRPVTLTRVARSGATSAWGLAEAARVAAAAPDVVLVEFAINDADIRDGLWLAESRRTHAALLDALALGAPQAQVVLMTMNPVTGALRRIQRPFLGAYYGMVRDLAAQRELALADLAPRWQAALAADPGLAPPDGLHPATPAAERVVVPPLAMLIGAAAGRDC